MALTKLNARSASALDATILTGALPAISGASLTGIDSSLTPSFSAYLSSDQSIAHDTYVKMIFDSEDNDTDSAYDTSNGRFTVPSGKGGRYAIGWMGSYDGASADSVPYSTFTWYKNGSQQVSSHTADYSATSRRTAAVCDVIVDTLSAGDYIEVYAFHYKGSAADLQGGEYKNHFWGYKIG